VKPMADGGLACPVPAWPRFRRPRDRRLHCGRGHPICARRRWLRREYFTGGPTAPSGATGSL